MMGWQMLSCYTQNKSGPKLPCLSYLTCLLCIVAQMHTVYLLYRLDFVTHKTVIFNEQLLSCWHNELSWCERDHFVGSSGSTLGLLAQVCCMQIAVSTHKWIKSMTLITESMHLATWQVSACTVSYQSGYVHSTQSPHAEVQTAPHVSSIRTISGNAKSPLLATITASWSHHAIQICLFYYLFLPSIGIFPREFKKKKNWKGYDQSIHAVKNQQAVMEQDSIQMLHQNRQTLV